MGPDVVQGMAHECLNTNIGYGWPVTPPSPFSWSAGASNSPITGELEDTDILRFITENADHPDVVRFFQVSEKRSSGVKEKRAQAAAAFDPTKLKIQYGATWVVSLEYSGLTTEERLDDKLYRTEEEAKAREEELQGPAKATFQLFCYIREGPEVRRADTRYMKEFVGLPTSAQIEEFLKISMAAPIELCKPCIPQTLLFTHNLMPHQDSLLPFLDDMPLPFSFLFQPKDMRDPVQERDDKLAANYFSEYMGLAMKHKEQGNAAYAKGERERAVDHPPERDAETRKLLAVCYANCAAARMLVVEGGEERDLKAAVEDAEKAIKTDPTYAKAYTRLSRAYEALGNPYEAQEALVRGLRLKDLNKHYGLADHLLFLQTNDKGLAGLTSMDVFEAWLNSVLVDDEKTAALMKDLGGAWQQRCDEHRKSIASA
ncbi:unnamed protein product [Cyclocybe aegerita]|uniref:Uncharacterized protein n=1 Tax=Cyclocybe aegerita TaxID=1973307 RepID=A0A8S0VZW3_CYCAE|nr:unnamed protein product [Cyclocybe aegerita]